MPKANDYLGIIIFLLLLAFVLYLAIVLQVRQNITINKIDLSGGVYLSNEDYLSFARLDTANNFNNLNAAIIKDRLEKHPYIRKANVKLWNDGKAEINVYEKKISAFLNCSEKQYLISDRYEALPLLSLSKEIDCPVISNPANQEKIKNFGYMLKNDDVKTAFKIIETTKLLGKEMQKSVSEIDLRKGKDIVVRMVGINYPVVLGRNNEIRKMAYFSKFWNHLKGKELNKEVDYIDLRFDKHLYLGFLDDINEETGI